jgi:hypothetical protein
LPGDRTRHPAGRALQPGSDRRSAVYVLAPCITPDQGKRRMQLFAGPSAAFSMGDGRESYLISQPIKKSNHAIAPFGTLKRVAHNNDPTYQLLVKPEPATKTVYMWYRVLSHNWDKRQGSDIQPIPKILTKDKKPYPLISRPVAVNGRSRSSVTADRKVELTAGG